MKLRFGLLSISLAMMFSLACLADDVKILTNPSAEDFVKFLGNDAVPEMGKTRGIKPLDRAAPPHPPAIALTTLQFKYNSAELTAGAKAMLDQLAIALKSDKLKQGQFVIEGHTDSIGSAAYNKQLSAARAKSVVDYLTQNHGIEPSRLTAVGRGKSEPLPGLSASDPANRRVQVARKR